MMRFGPTELEAPRLAAKKEKRATKSAKIQILLFSESEAAKQNQKFPFHFLSAPPPPPPQEKKKGKENFLGLLPRPQGAGEARRIRAYGLVSSHHARGACDIICFESKCELGTIETPEQNLTAFSKPEGGTREARPTDFPPFFQTNSAPPLGRDGGFFRQEAGVKSEPILTNFALPEIQKEFLSL